MDLEGVQIDAVVMIETVNSIAQTEWEEVEAVAEVPDNDRPPTAIPAHSRVAKRKRPGVSRRLQVEMRQKTKETHTHTHKNLEISIN